jgi:hypothetical protein
MVRLGKLRQAKPKTKATARQAWQDTDRRSTRDVRSGNHDAAKAGGGRATSSRNFLTPLALRVCCAGLFGCQFGEPVPITPQIGRFWERLVTCLAQGALGLVRLRNVDQRPRRGCKCALTNRGSPLVWFLPTPRSFMRDAVRISPQWSLCGSYCAPVCPLLGCFGEESFNSCGEVWMNTRVG